MEIAEGWDGEDHVDLVHNQWAAGKQTLLARLTLRDGHVHVDDADPGAWRETLLLTYRLPDGSAVDPDSHPGRFLNGLHTHLSGDYLLASKPHRLSECRFVADSLLMPPADAGSHQPAHGPSRSSGRGPRSRELHAS
jgi:hypothetical protein